MSPFAHLRPLINGGIFITFARKHNNGCGTFAPNMPKIQFEPIGIIRSPFKDIDGMPIQPRGAEGVEGVLEMDPRYEEGLQDLDGFSHIFLIYHFHLSDGYSLKVKPFLDKEYRGVFSTRAPKRPNPIGLSVVELVKVMGSDIYVRNIDVIDGTPLLDIKPYVPEFDHFQTDSTGWLSARSGQVSRARADRRFG